MEELTTHVAAWLIPCVLVIFQLFLKLLVNEPFGMLRTWKATLNLPTDIGFLALSFVAATVISRPEQVAGLFTAAITYVLLLLLSVAIAKNSPLGASRKELGTAFGLVALNFLITVPMLVYSISIL